LICALRLVEDHVSAQHALIRYNGSGWVLRDLASLNGTWLDGRRIAAGEEVGLRRGARLAFGDPGTEWEITSDGPPVVMVVPLDGGSPIVIEGDLLPLPSVDEPMATIYRALGESWVIEEGDRPPVLLADLRVFQCIGRSFRFSCPGGVLATRPAEASAGTVRLRDLAFELSVSLNEEHVVMRTRHGERVTDFGERACHYLLLILARARLADASQGLPEPQCGWVDVEDICRHTTTPSQINVDVYRNRRQLSEHKVVDGPQIVERRPGQIRLGVGNVRVSRE
jgi:hypothetical protein